MPTAAKLTAGILWGALAWYVSNLMAPLFPEGTNLGWFAEFNAAIGVLCGWNVAGSRAKTTWSEAVGYGITATVALVFWCLFLHSLNEMIAYALRKLYDGPVEALIGVFAIMLDHTNLLLNPQVMATLIGGGILSGFVTEWVGRRFP
jgi:hypothetical protein